MATPDRRQLLASLSSFYDHPVVKTSVELFLSIGAVLFFAIFAIRPTLLTMSDLIKEIDDKKALDKQLGQKVAALSSAQSEFFKVEPRLAVLNQAIPTNPELIKTLKIVEKIASDQKITINSLTINDVPKEIPPNSLFTDLEKRNLTFTITVGGDFPAIREFIEQLMNSQRSFIIQKITFAINDVRGLKRLDATITVAAPYYGQKP
jgi:Tfp pilus assembly protein PilO